VKIVNDNYLYCKVAKFIEDKSKLAEDKIEALTDLVGDEDKAKEIVEAAKASMGIISYFCVLLVLLFILFLNPLSLYFQDKICPLWT
jgi:hypothetical protein